MSHKIPAVDRDGRPFEPGDAVGLDASGQYVKMQSATPHNWVDGWDKGHWFPPATPVNAPVGVQSRVYFTPKVAMRVETPLPNRWRRFWYWALLGWTWEEVKKGA